MTDRQNPEQSRRWRRIEADGAEWEVRLTAAAGTGGVADGRDAEIMEFVCVDGSRKARRLSVERGTYGGMDDAAVRSAYLMSRPIGGDHYGRPGKQMNDLG